MSEPAISVEMLSIDEAEREYGITRATIYRYIQKGELKTFRRGMDRRAYLRRADLEHIRRFRLSNEATGFTLAALQRARDFRRQVFGGLVLPDSSAEIIEEGRRERTEELS